MATTGERRSISGIRGTAESLPCGRVVDYAKAYATFLRDINAGNTIVIGRDTRPMSAEYTERVIEGLTTTGWDVIDLGIVPTPTVQIAIGKLGAAGGVVVTASHNPVEYHGLKFLHNRDGHGMFLEKPHVNAVFDLYDQRTFDQRRPGKVRFVAELASEFDDPPYTGEYVDRHRPDLDVPNRLILDHHMHRVVSAMGRELDLIRGMNFRVAMDSCGGAGIPLNYVLLDYLYCQLRRVNDEPGVFPRPIEPTPPNLAGLCASLKEDDEPHDVGFVTDCDNDRCVLIARNPDTGEYEPLEEDYTLAIALDQVLDQAPPGSTVVTNWSTSQMLHDVASKHHANLRRAPVGEVYTAVEAVHYHAAMAGEGSCAGVIDPRVGMGRDCLVAIWHILSALACKRESLHALAESLPKYAKVNRDHASNRSIEDTRLVLEAMQSYYAAQRGIQFINREDGLVVFFEDRSRIQIRSSNTEPVLRVRSEAPDGEAAERLVQDALAFIAKETAGDGA
ncbi:MAG: hypothetical protein GY851_31580 [bacterium]|nr:hypothetical protein [bacterium]